MFIIRLGLATRQVKRGSVQIRKGMQKKQNLRQHPTCVSHPLSAVGWRHPSLCTAPQPLETGLMQTARNSLPGHSPQRWDRFLNEFHGDNGTASLLEDQLDHLLVLRRVKKEFRPGPVGFSPRQEGSFSWCASVSRTALAQGFVLPSGLVTRDLIAGDL